MLSSITHVRNYFCESILIAGRNCCGINKFQEFIVFKFFNLLNCFQYFRYYDQLVTMEAKLPIAEDQVLISRMFNS